MRSKTWVGVGVGVGVGCKIEGVDHRQGQGRGWEHLRQREAMVLGLSRETSLSSVISGAASPAGAASICGT